jgi:hypothetical protein
MKYTTLTDAELHRELIAARNLQDRLSASIAAGNKRPEIASAHSTLAKIRREVKRRRREERK